MNKTGENFYQKLAKLLQIYQQYYEIGKPLVSDEVYDALYLQLAHIEHTASTNAQSPTQKVGYNLANRSLHHHLKPMLSLEHAFGEQGLDKFDQKITNFLKNKPGAFVAQHKIDGVSVALRYRDGHFATAALRGDGIKGEDVTAHMLAIGIPVQFELENCADFEIRGELYVPLNSIDQDFASARHNVAGAVRLLDIQQFQKRNVHFLAYGYAMINETGVNSYFDIMQQIAQHFDIVKQQLCENLDQMRDFFIEQQNNRSKFNYLLDGCVFKVNDVSLWPKLGYNAKSPKYAFAIKFDSTCSSAYAQKVIWSVGRTGAITPVLITDTLVIDNIQINRITLHNVSEFERHNLGAGDLVVVKRAGDVIPAIVSSVAASTPRFEQPVNCPSCNSVLVRQDKILLCLNNWNCKEQLVDRIDHMLKAYEIDALGDKKLNLLVEKGLLSEWADIFNLAQYKSMLEQWPGWGEKSVDKILSNINNGKNIEFKQFLFGLGIREIGSTLASKIALYIQIEENNQQTWLNFINFIDNKAVEIEGIGVKIIEQINIFIEQNRAYVLELLEHIIFKPTQSYSEANAIYVVLTGTFSVSKQALKSQAPKNTALSSQKHIIFMDSINAKTNIVVYADKSSNKFKKAEQMGLKLLNEREWEEYCKAIGGKI